MSRRICDANKLKCYMYSICILYVKYKHVKYAAGGFFELVLVCCSNYKRRRGACTCPGCSTWPLLCMCHPQHMLGLTDVSHPVLWEGPAVRLPTLTGNLFPATHGGTDCCPP